MRTLTALTLLALCPTAAHAGAKITMASIAADGLEMQKLSCDLDSGGFFGGIAVVGMVAKQKPALDACAPAGAAFSIDLDFRGGRTNASVTAGGTPAQRACIKRTLTRVFATVAGRCSAVLLAGASEAARKAGTADAAPADSTSTRTAEAARVVEPEAPSAQTHAPSPLATLRPEQLRGLIGLSVGSKPAQAVLAPLAADRKVSVFDDCSYHNYSAHGLSLRLVGNTITSVFLYAQGADDYQAYAGALPDGLAWTDTRRAVESKLGAPTKTGGEGVIAFWAEYRPGLSVTYRLKSPTSLDNAVHHLVLSAPK